MRGGNAERITLLPEIDQFISSYRRFQRGLECILVRLSGKKRAPDRKRLADRKEPRNLGMHYQRRRNVHHAVKSAGQVLRLLRTERVAHSRSVVDRYLPVPDFDGSRNTQFRPNTRNRCCPTQRALEISCRRRSGLGVPELR